MSQKKIILIVIVLVVIAALVGVAVFTEKSPPGGAPTGGSATGGTTGGGQTGSATRASVAGDITVPEKGSAAPENVAVPEVVGAASPNSSASYRGFSIAADGDKFVPDTVIAKEKDTVRITITAVDKDYDFTQPDYGFSVPIPKGQSKPIEFGATASGEFTFYCSVCGGPAKGPVGYIIVAPK